MKLNVAICFLLFSALSACSSSRKSTEKDAPPPVPVPEWVKSRPMDNHHYIGIAVIDKKRYPNRYAEEAKKQALNDLASEIEVDIKSASMLFTFENGKGDFQDEYRSYSQVTTNKSLQGYELEDIYETDDKYHVFYRLSKARYEREKNARIRKAIDESQEYVRTAEQYMNNRRYRDAFVALMKGMQSIEPYAGEPLRTEWESKEVFWGNYLLSRINEFSSRLNLSPGDGAFTVKWGLPPEKEALTFHLKDVEGNAVAGIPVRLEYSEGFIRPRLVLSDMNGEVAANLDKIREKKNVQTLKAEVDLVEMFNSAGGDKADRFMENLINRITAPETQKRFDVIPPSVHLAFKANEVPKNTVITNDIADASRERLTELGFRKARNAAGADLIMSIDVHIKLLETMSDMHRCDLNGRVDVIMTQSGQSVFSEALPTIRGVQLSDPAAVQNAVYKAADEMNETTVPRFHRALLR